MPRLRCIPGYAIASVVVISCGQPAKSVSPTPTASVVRPSPLPPTPQPEALAVTYDDVGESTVYLEDSFAEQERRRARPKRAGPLFWTLEEAKNGAVGLEGNDDDFDEPWMSTVVAERHPTHLRIVADSEDFRITGYMRVEDMHRVTRMDAVLLQKDGEPFADGCGLHMPAGTVLQLRKPSLGLHRVVVHHDWLEATGSVPPSWIDHVYTEGAPRPKSLTRDCTLKLPVTLRDGPGGAVVAELTQDREDACNLLGAVRSGFRKVAYHRDGFRVVGYAPVDHVQAEDEGEVGWLSGGMGGGWGASHTTFIYLWPGDALFPPKGAKQQIGRVRARALQAGDYGEAGDMRTVHFPIHPWSFTNLRIERTTYDAALRKHAAWLSRVVADNITVTGGGTVGDVARDLQDERGGLSGCFDDLLEKNTAFGATGTPMSYGVKLKYEKDRPDPEVTPAKAPELEGAKGFVSCMQIWLRSNETALLGTTATFDLTFTPNAELDG